MSDYLPLQQKSLAEIAKHLKRIADALEGRAAVLTPEEAPPTEVPAVSYLPAKDLEAALAPYLKTLDVIDVEGKLIIESLEWRDKEEWRKINKIIKAHGGQWITGGKESHWEVPK